MNNLFEEAYTPWKEEKDLIAGTWTPSVDIYETENALVLTSETPGMDEKDFEINIEDGTLALKGERKFEKEEKKENYHRIERSYGNFHRSFTLPATVDRDNIKAHYKDGVLEVTLPITEEAKPKSIPVEVN